MKTFLMKNRLLLPVLLTVSALGLGLWGVLGCTAKRAMQEKSVPTAAELAAESEPDAADAAPTPIPFSAEAIQYAVTSREGRREQPIPPAGSVSAYQPDSWSKAAYTGDTAAVFAAVTGYSEALFDYAPAADAPSAYALYTDGSGARAAFIRMETAGGLLVCCVDAETLTLLSIDYAVTDAAPVDPQLMCARIAAALGAEVDSRVELGSAGAVEIVNGTVRLSEEYIGQLTDGRCFRFALLQGTPYAVTVHPSRAHAEECVFFDADIRWDSAVVSAAYPENFTEGDAASPQAGDLTLSDATMIYRRFLSAANGRAIRKGLDYNTVDVTYFIDRSGHRENYYRFVNAYVDMQIAAKSGYIVRLTCENLYNAEYDLRSIPYEQMGGREYEDYVRYVLGQTFGQEQVDEILPNAVYDDAYCTVGGSMQDGALYEFFFTNGLLTQIQYTFDVSYWCRVLPGWEADSYIKNSLTGEIYLNDDY